MTELRTRESQEIMKAEEQQLAQTIAEHVNILDSGLWLLNETKKKVFGCLVADLENMSFFKILLTLLKGILCRSVLGPHQTSMMELF